MRARSGTTSERSEKSSHVTSMPAARAIATMWSVWLVEPPVACRPTMPFTIAFSSITSPTGVYSLPSPLIASARRVASSRQRIAERRVRVDERGAGDVQPHDLHQHLVGVGGAVEGAGAGAVVGLRLRLEQLRAPDLPLDVELADLRLFVVRHAARHRPGRDEHRRQMAERERPDQEPRHDLVADAEIDRRVEHVVRERHARRRARSRRARTATAPCPPAPA